MSGRIIRGVSNAHAAACQSRGRRELAQIQREDTRHFTEITTALRNAEHIPPERIADYLKLISTTHERCNDHGQKKSNYQRFCHGHQTG
jgi:hypothetical protein